MVRTFFKGYSDTRRDALPAAFFKNTISAWNKDEDMRREFSEDGVELSYLLKYCYDFPEYLYGDKMTIPKGYKGKKGEKRIQGLFNRFVFKSKIIIRNVKSIRDGRDIPSLAQNARKARKINESISAEMYSGVIDAEVFNMDVDDHDLVGNSSVLSKIDIVDGANEWE